ncbi:MAG: Asp-tRNA(Asn)/Glu-tRNA(Gln) amidotransferase subunit GatC [Phycisphaerae bacterium]
MSATLDEKTIRHVARLARLHITEEEVARYVEQLSSVLSYVEQLNELDTENVAPTTQALCVSNVFREDEVRASLSPDAALASAPQHKDGFFQVPRILDHEGSA